MDIYIDSESAVRGRVRRLVTTRDEYGTVIDESYTDIVGEHWVDLQPLSSVEQLQAEQLQIKVTHKVFPELNYVPSVSLNDFYLIDGRNYRIVEEKDFRTLGYFKVWDGAFGTDQPDTAIVRTVYSYIVHGLGPGVYTFGVGALADVPVFEITPLILDMRGSDSGYWLDDKSETGFTIYDRGTGVVPVVSVFIQGIPA